jgi:chromosome segregation protein
MHIRELEIDNFKSFANKVTIPFLEGFTTISGPNGSGKSNIIDSMLFGLGLSSSRALRAERLHHLISTHNKRDDASVKITFADENSDKALIVERRIKKASGGFVSSYYMNGKGSTLSEIHEKLSEYNISPGSYNVIMQGDVTTITNSSALERRRILDEIAGISDFDKKIEQATKELLTVEERVEKSSIILNEIDIRLESLEKQKDEALKYQKLKQEKQEFESKLSTVKYFDIKSSLERLHENMLDVNKSRKVQENELGKIELVLGETRTKLKEISDLVKQKGEDEQLEIKKQAETLRSDIATKKNTIEYVNRQVENNILAIKNVEINIVKLKEKIDDALHRIDNKKDEIKVLEKNIEREKEELNRVLTEVSQVNKEANENVKRRNLLRSQFESKKDEENLVLKEKLPLEEKHNRYEREIKEAKEIIENFEETTLKNLSEKDLMIVQIEELAKELKDYEMMQKNAFADLDNAKGELDESTHNIQLAYRKVAQLEANKRASEEANFGRAVETIMKSNLSGVHAPLAKLGVVDKNYSSAMEVAMGGRMTNIVVEDDEVASTAIEILKSSGAGRATFLPLNKIQRAPRDMKLPRENGVIDYAINLVEFDEIYKDAFYFALRDTLIVEDMSTARKLTGKFRMVTLDGSIVEKAGSMTGGSLGRTGLKFSNTQDEELKLYKDKLVEFEQVHRKLESRKNELENKISSIRQDYSSTMTALSRKKIELESLEKNIAASQKTLEEKKLLVVEFEPELEKTRLYLGELTKKQELLQQEILKISAEIEKVENSIPENELNKLNQLSEEVDFQIRKYQTTVSNAQNDIKNINMEISFTNQAIEAQKERAEKLNSDNEIFEKDKKLNEIQIIQISEKLKELNEKIAEIGLKLVELQKQRDVAQEEVITQEKSKNSLELNIKRVEETIEALKTRRKELEPELFAIRNELLQAGYEIAALQKLEISTEEVLKAIQKIDRKMEEMGNVNMMAINEFEEVNQRKEELRNKLQTLSLEREQITLRMQSYEELKKRTFLETFTAVNDNFQQIFADLSDGTGKLILEHPDDPLSGGLTIEAQPRDKKMQRLESMSGGEKSLTALAFVFAIQRYMPAPFYAFDEVDMHLDGLNVEKLAEMIKKQAQNTQFIVVSLRKPMIESADRTVGVTQKDSGVTKVTGVKLSD